MFRPMAGCKFHVAAISAVLSHCYARATRKEGELEGDQKHSVKERRVQGPPFWFQFCLREVRREVE